VPSHPAQPGLIAEPVDLAQARADAATIRQQREPAAGAVVELAGRVEREVGRLVVAHAGSVARGELEVTRVGQRP
jgi:hypothetical protein